VAKKPLAKRPADPILEAFGPHLKSLLLRRKMRPADLARAAGLAPPVITRLINQERTVKLETVLRIARALGMSIDELLSFDHKQEERAPSTWPRASRDGTGRRRVVG
jgi:plasmid maintenance system antidote protein VapI